MLDISILDLDIYLDDFGFKPTTRLGGGLMVSASSDEDIYIVGVSRNGESRQLYVPFGNRTWQ